MNILKQQPLITFRVAKRDDVSDIVRLLADDMLGSQREKYQNPLPQSYYEAFDEIQQDGNSELIVAEMNGEIVGTLQMTFIYGLSFQGSKRAQIEAVRVDKKCRNQGVGTKLLDWAIARAREKTCQTVQLTTNNARTDAQRFYVRLGFVASHIGMKLDLLKK